MKFTIKFTLNALQHLGNFNKSEGKLIVDEIKKQLFHEPFTQTKNRKPLRRNPLSRWELRVKKYRIFYDCSEEGNVVEIKAVGYKKHNKLFINGKEFEI
ncbi:MAG: plasmid stabilization protein ParE [Desulfobacteraceae bacterium IS3]|nr:MAG: plasmid stabilization protein ParE [Desulfobacteraceae bacterium IS3]